MYIPEEFIARLLGSVNIVEVIQKRRQVERRGGAYMCKCPFHKGGEEKNASMKIYEETGTFHCFTCKETGNACLLYTSPSPRDKRQSRMPSSA